MRTFVVNTESVYAEDGEEWNADILRDAESGEEPRLPDGSVLVLLSDVTGFVPDGVLRAVREGVTATERAACAGVVRSAGCLCYELYVANVERGTVFTGEWSIREDRAIYHDPRCPVALATSIEAQ